MHQTSPSARRIVVTTAGSLGDLHPYLAIALGLKARGHEAIMATGECYRNKIEALGLGFRAVRPDCDWVNNPEVMQRIMHPRWGLVRVFREIWVPVLRQAYDDLLAATEGADLLVAMQGAGVGRLVAEKRGMPWVTAMHIPLLLASAYDPPILPGFVGLSKKLRSFGPTFGKPFRDLLKWATRVWARPLLHLRDELGLPPDTSLNPLTDGQSPSLHLALFSKWLLDKQPDWPPQTIVTGFPWHDQEGAPNLPRDLARFLDDGSPPIVFTLGSAVSNNSGAPQFFEHSAAAAKLLGRRAVLILKGSQNLPGELPNGVIACDYAPFSEIFPRAAAIVHHGGIGTTGLAMHSGRPTLIVPWAWDQPDNAERAARLGVSRTISVRRYTPRCVAGELRQLLDDPTYSQRAAEVAKQLQQEDGVGAACDAIEALLQAASFAENTVP
jgi:UDP:flavonoid glycosyltransferase YjiC (YdhE family)